jgi:small subunit ribosomal protein S21
MSNNDSKTRKDNSLSKALRGGDTDSRNSSIQEHSDAVQATPLEVKVYNNDCERAIKAFRTLVQKERVLSSYKEKQTYEKPSDRKRRKRNEARRKASEASEDCESDYCTDSRRNNKR